MNKIYNAVTSEWFILVACIAVSLIGYGLAYDFDGIPLLSFILATGAIVLVLTYRAGQRSRNHSIHFWINMALLNSNSENREFYTRICGEEKTKERINLALEAKYRPEDTDWNRL